MKYTTQYNSAITNQKKIVEKLDLNISNRNAEILYKLAYDNNVSGIRNLLTGVDYVNPNLISKTRSKTACWISTYKQNNNALDILLRYGANPNIPDENGVMPLYFAIAYQNVESVKLLVENGAEISDDDKRRAFRDGNSDIINLLG